MSKEFDQGEFGPSQSRANQSIQDPGPSHQIETPSVHQIGQTEQRGKNPSPKKKQPDAANKPVGPQKT